MPSENNTDNTKTFMELVSMGENFSTSTTVPESSDIKKFLITDGYKVIDASSSYSKSEITEHVLSKGNAEITIVAVRGTGFLDGADIDIKFKK